MRFVPFLLFLAAGCGSPPVREEPAKPPPPINPGDAAPETPAQDGGVVAFIDKEPVSWRAVVDHAMGARGKDLIDKYILWKLRKDKLEELGIKNSPDDLRRRAQLLLGAYKQKAGDEQFKKKLEELKTTEAAYVERFVTNAEFDEHVKSEKAVIYTLLTENSVEIDTVAFTDPQEAAAFIANTARMTFGEAMERQQALTNTQGRVAFWPRYRFAAGVAPDAIASTPELEQKLFRMKKGQTTGVEKTSAGILVVMNIVDTYAASPAPYASIAEKVLSEVLRQPPSEDQIRLWMDRLFKSKRITYEDRYSPRNQGR